MHVHKWTKWVIGDQGFINTQTGATHTLGVQVRQCEKCGKTQVEKL
jgi:hypothetical protein